MHSSKGMVWKCTLLPLGLTFGLGLMFGNMEVVTGLVYNGLYHYTARLGIKFLDLVPLPIPVAWFKITYLFCTALRAHGTNAHRSDRW